MKKGFTLIEILIALFILVLVAAVVFPTFSGLVEQGIAADARAVASIIRYLDDTSKQTGTEAEMHIQLDGKTIRYPHERGERTKEIRTLRSAELTSAGLRETGELTVRFSPPGLAEQLRVRLDDGTERRDVVYNPYSGRIRIQEGTAGEDEGDRGA